MFNITKDEPKLNSKIFISSIQKAEILKFSHYDVSNELISKIDEDESLQTYNFDRYDNIPIDGIKEKLFLGKYINKDILFPIVRLGNKKFVSEALKMIKRLYEFETKDVPKENLLSKFLL